MNILKKLGIANNEDYKDFFTEEKIKELEKIMEEVEKDIFFPNPLNIFRFTSVPVKDIKCIFIGQDAYPSYKVVADEEKSSFEEKISKNNIDNNLGFLINKNNTDNNLDSSIDEDIIENNWEEIKTPTEDLESITVTENKNPATETIIIEKDWEEENKEKEKEEKKMRITLPSGYNKTHPHLGTLPVFDELFKVATECFKDDTTKYLNLHTSNELRNKLKIEMDYDNTPVMTYKGYVGSIKYNKEDDILYGEIKYINDSINYHGSNIEELRKSFEKAVDDFVEMLTKLNRPVYQVFGPMGGLFYPHDTDDEFDLDDDDDEYIDPEIVLENIKNIKLEKYINGILVDDLKNNNTNYKNSLIETPEGLVIPEATGRSFEVNSMMTWTDKIKQSSLRNILKSLYYLETGEKKSMKEIREEILSGNFSILPPHEWFDYLESQGVVFLNTSLTVKMGKAGSHLKLWESFMNDLVKYIDSKNPEIKWILAGKVSQERITPLISYSVQTDHPRLDSFVTQCPFMQVDDVDWIGKDKGET